MILDLGPTFVPKTVTDVLRQLSTMASVGQKVSVLNDFVTKLELEMTRIHPFKDEIPLCMVLLNDAISALKVDSAKCRAHNSEPVLQEFFPLKKECVQKVEENRKEKEFSNKKNWMSSVQLWNTTITSDDYNSHKHKIKQLEIKQKNEGERQYGAEEFLVPFSPNSATMEEKEDSDIDGLSLKIPATVMKISREGTSFNQVVPSSPQQKNAGKQRRRWSPELHNRFAEALEKLGGSQAATPKKIIELMGVDGLTKDEVSSHLQKYRLKINKGRFSLGSTSGFGSQGSSSQHDS